MERSEQFYYTKTTEKKQCKINTFRAALKIKKTIHNLNSDMFIKMKITYLLLLELVFFELQMILGDLIGIKIFQIDRSVYTT